MDSAFANVIAIHIQSFNSHELEVFAEVQSAALLALGLLFQGTSHRRMTEGNKREKERNQ
jgi:hypothetical protein